MILMIDNYDSFTYNLVQYLGELGQKLIVKRNDEITAAQIAKMRPEFIVISPGPGTPDDAGVSLDVIKKFGEKIPILGVCLGHQCIAQAYGGKIILAPRVMHGKTSLIYHRNHKIFTNVDNPFHAARYHSLIAEHKTLPESLEIISWTDENEIMGVCHKQNPVIGLQFHPESILTNAGKDIISNFIKYYG